MTFLNRLIDGWLAKRNAGRSFARGNRLYQKGEFTDAVAAYREAVAMDPTRPVLRYNLGLALYKAGEKTAARSEWTRVLELCAGNSHHAYLEEQTRIMLRQFG